MSMSRQVPNVWKILNLLIPAPSLFLYFFYVLVEVSTRTSGFHRFVMNQNGIDRDKSKEVCAEREMDALIESQLAIALTSKT